MAARRKTRKKTTRRKPLSAKRRSAIARKAAKARWKGHKKAKRTTRRRARK